MAIRIDTKFKLNGYIESLIGGRSENQDSAGALDTKIGTIITVCDGMGGLTGGKTASMIAVKTIIDDVASADRYDDPKTVLTKAIIRANDAIIKAGEDDPDLRGMGTTVAAVIINKNYATVAHVGDSRVYQLRGHKKVFRTNDHSQVFEQVKAGILTEEQARTSSSSNVILNALGIFDKVEPEIHKLPYIAGDRFLICSDGFWGALPENDFLALVTESGDIEEVIKNSCSEVNLIGIKSGSRHDNLTAAVFELECDSKMKIPMKKSIKIIFLSIIALLVISVILNIVTFNHNKAMRPVIKATEAFRDNLALERDTTLCVKDFAKTIDSLSIKK
jgi:PPM family protein phosphatase